MCFLVLLAVYISLWIWKKTKKPVVALISVIFLWWLLQFLFSLFLLKWLLEPVKDDDQNLLMGYY